MTNDELNPNDEARSGLLPEPGGRFVVGQVAAPPFVIRVSTFLRHLAFVIRHLTALGYEHAPCA